MPYKHCCLILGVALFLTVGFCLLTISRRAAKPMHLYSEVVPPTTKLLANLNELAQAGECELVAKKLELWQKLWLEYREGGETPEMFNAQIIGLTSEAIELQQ